MYDYGNARVAALRSRLLDVTALRRIAEAGGPVEVLALLERSDDWRPILRETRPLSSDPLAAIEASIERHRSARLGSLVGWYDDPARRLVEALVLRVDLDRIVAIVRRRQGGEAPGALGDTIVAGALLDIEALGRIARVAPTGLGRMLRATGLVAPADAEAIDRGIAEQRGQRWLEERLVAAVDAARAARAEGRGRDARLVRAILAGERAERAEVAAESREVGPGAAWPLEREATLARLERVARAGPRDPLGIGAVAGYVAALDAQAIRLRASLARVVAGWSPETVRPYLATGAA